MNPLDFSDKVFKKFGIGIDISLLPPKFSSTDTITFQCDNSHIITGKYPSFLLKGKRSLCVSCDAEEKAKQRWADFLCDVNEVHNHKFRYTDPPDGKLESLHSYVSIICPIHGEYSIKAYTHLLHDCNKCSYVTQGITGRLTDSDIRSKIHSKFGEDRYEVIGHYRRDKDGRVYVRLRCLEHDILYEGDLYLILSSNKAQCPICRNAPVDKETFIKCSKAIHGDNSNILYDKVVYVDRRTRVTLTCKDHGDFECLPSSHLERNQKTTCPLCTPHRFGWYSAKKLLPERYDEPAILYHLRFYLDDGTSFDKIGITIRTIRRRFKSYGMRYDIIDSIESDLYSCFWAEEYLKRSIPDTGTLHHLRDIGFAGWTECFDSGYELDINDQEVWDAIPSRLDSDSATDFAP